MIAIGCDHAGYILKENIKEFLTEQNIPFKDFGAYTTEAVDYPTIAKNACEAITSGECEKGILICGTGIGMSIAANKIKGIRAAACSDYFTAKATRMHNDANVLCFGERVVGSGTARELVYVFLTTEYEGGRHQHRVDQMMDLEAL